MSIYFSEYQGYAGTSTAEFAELLGVAENELLAALAEREMERREHETAEDWQ